MISFYDNDGASDDSVIDSGCSKIKATQSHHSPGQTRSVPEG
jgi:hypothetical protein